MKISINIKEARVEKKEFIFGIDLGTTNSLIARVNPDTGKAETLKDQGRNALVPSVIHLQDGVPAAIGTEAMPYLLRDPANTIYSVKRLMGRSYGDIREHERFFSYQVIDDPRERLLKIHAAGHFYTPVELSSLLLKSLKDRAEKLLGEAVNKVVITVPAYFNDAQRQATRDAGKLAGLDVLRIVNEPTAASLAYGIGLNPEEEKTIAVYDLGGGTFDISILKINQGVFEVLSTNGNTYLGGDDFDRAIADAWMPQLLPALQEEAAQTAVYRELRLLAETAKKHLSTQESWQETVSFASAPGLSQTLQLSRTQFNRLAEPFITKTLACCRQALQDAQLKKEDIDTIVMVGGATRIPAVKEAVRNFFGRAVHDQLNPDEVVALGAAIQADVLAGNNKEVLLLDITPLSLGIETMGGLMDVLIPRNTRIPVQAGRQYTTSTDGQKNMRITVYQGERDLVRDNRKLAEFVLQNIPAMPTGLPKIEVKFLLNADGILQVSATELRSGVAQQIEVTPQYGLTDAEVEKMLLDSITHAREDMQLRAVAEAVTEGTQMLRDTERFLEKNKSLLTPEEITATQKQMSQLKESFNSQDKDLIHTAIEALNACSAPYAQRVMDAAIGEAMKGKNI